MKAIKQVKEYRFIKQIGKGATATVYEGINDKTNKVVAIKTIPSEKLSERRNLENFKREISLLKSLKHENIIKIEGIEKTTHNVYVILEYCNGGNLYEYKCYYQKKNKCELNELFVQKIIRQFIKGLEYMHENNIIHRDVKLENIMLNFNKFKNEVKPGELFIPVNYDNVTLNDDFTVKIADLGFARNLEGGGVASTICGTPITMAPDIMGVGPSKEGKSYNNKADLWSLGAITYELLIGRVPFYASSYNLLKQEINKGTYVLPKKLKLSVEAITFINGLLQFEAKNRMDWGKIKAHPFIVNNVADFHFIDLHNVGDINDDNLELNTKNCDNYLWLNYKNSSFNMALDKVNEEEIKKPEMKKIIEEKKTVNEEILKAVEEEKKKLEEERKKIELEKKEAERLRLEAEQKIKEAEEKNKQLKLEEDEKRIREKEKELKELQEKKENEKKQKELLQQLLEEKKKVEEERKRIEDDRKKMENERIQNLKIKEEAEAFYNNAQQIQESAQKKEEELKKERDIELSKRMELEQNKEELEKKRKEEQERYNQQKKEMEKLQKELEHLKNEANSLKNEVIEKNKLQLELEQKQKEKEDLISKINQIENEKDRQLMELEKEKKEKELKLLEETQKRKQEELKRKEAEIQNDILKKEKEIANFQGNNVIQFSVNANSIDPNNDEWEDLTVQSIDYQVTETGSKFQIMNEYFK